MELTNLIQYELLKRAIAFIRERTPKVYMQIQYDMIRTTMDVKDKTREGLLTINIDPAVLYSMSMDYMFCTVSTKIESVGDITLAFPTKAIVAIYSPDLNMVPVLFQFVSSDEKPAFGTDLESTVKSSVELLRNEPLIEVQPTHAKIYTFDLSLRGKKP